MKIISASRPPLTEGQEIRNRESAIAEEIRNNRLVREAGYEGPIGDIGGGKYVTEGWRVVAENSDSEYARRREPTAFFATKARAEQAIEDVAWREQHYNYCMQPAILAEIAAKK